MIARRQQSKKRAYGERRAPEKLSLERRVEGGALHPSLKGKGEGSEAYSVSFFRCAKMLRLHDILMFICYKLHLSEFSVAVLSNYVLVN